MRQYFEKFCGYFTKNNEKMVDNSIELRYIIIMKILFVFFILLFNINSIMASPARTSPAPTHNVYGGDIFFKNTSTYNQYWEIDIIDNPKGGFYFDRICLEKNDIVRRRHYFHVLFADDDKFDRSSADPNNYFEQIRIYDMDTGELLKEFNSGDEIFILDEGSIERGAIWKIDIASLLLEGGN